MVAPSRQQAVIDSLLAISDGVRRVLERDLDTRDITFQQYNVLRILAPAGAEGLATLAVAERLLERTPGVTRLMDRLERQGFVSRTRGSDRRQVLCSITEAGAALVTELQPSVERAEQSVLACLNPNELGALQHFLNRLRANIDNT
ncbi:MAG TPA: MarR family transcriptional regulator [Gemmatimonadales bacterium]|nr:MarR family transcriptional regulator [Gemmatimonadales bacterium]